MKQWLSAFLHGGACGLLPSERGQEFEPFRLLIGAVFALAVLVIIIGAINYFEDLRLDVSRQRFMEGLNNAVKQPNGTPLEIAGIQLQAGKKYTSLEISKVVNIPDECISFGDSGSREFTVERKASVQVNANLLSDVMVVCTAKPADLPVAECEVGCVITFNEAQP